MQKQNGFRLYLNFEKHNDRGSDFHLEMYDAFVIGKDINAAEDIVYLNSSSLWHLCNILRNIAAGPEQDGFFN